MKTALLLFISLISLMLPAQVRPSHIFDSNMVLQREKPVKVWGLAAPLEKVKVEFEGQVKTTVANKLGEWSVYLDPMSADSKPGDMKVSGKNSSVIFTNVLVGDVWILGGQSNMEFDLARIFHGDVEIPSAHYPNIRLMTIPCSADLKPQNDFERINEYDGWYERYDKKGYWFICSPETVPTFSGLGYIFGRRLYLASQVPIGLIDVSMGGTTVEAWLNPETLARMPENSSLLKQWNDKVAAYDPVENLNAQIRNWEKDSIARIKEGRKPEPKPVKPSLGPAFDRNFPGSSYTGMIGVIAGLTVKGVVFHQGYNNALEDSRPKQYALNFKAMIKDWRMTFNDKDLPFGIIETSAGGEPQTRDNYELSMIDPTPSIREGQFKAFLDIPHTGYACSYDQQVNWYHPQKKVETGERMARWALATQYGFDLPWEPAVCTGIERLKDRIVVTFSKEVKSSDDRPVEGFCLAGSDRHFFPSKAVYAKTKDENGKPVDDRKRIEIMNTLVPDPVEVRYVWARNPMGNLVNSECPLIPVPLFRSDSWDYPEAPWLPDEYAAHRASLKNMRKQATEMARARIIREAETTLHENSYVQKMSDEFVNPPASYRPGAFWCWLNGNMSTAAITRDLEAMKSKGMNRAEIWDVAAVKNPSFIPAGGAFLGDESVRLIKHAISEGKRLKMSIGIIASSGWNAGGSWVTPDWASKNLFYSKVVTEGPQSLSMDLPFPKFPEGCPMKDKTTPVFYKDVAVLAVPFSADSTIASPSNVIRLTPLFKDGKLKWEVPEGKWVIMRFVCSNNGQQLIVPSPNSNGLFIDFFDPEATKRHLKYFMDRLGVTPENSAEAGLAYFEFDSMELADGTPWTDAFPSIFMERQGYDIEKYLPVLAGWDIKGVSARFRYDFNRVVSDQLIYSHYQTGTEFLKKYNAKLVSESGGPGAPVWNTCPVDALKALGTVSVPRGEFWIKHRNMFLIKEVASASHIYGQKIVDAESFTTWRRWKDSPFDMKKIVDRAFCEGLNNITFHTFASTNPEDGLPGRTYHAGYDMNPGTTWWEKSKPFMDYLARCSYLLQQGLFAADACYYYGDQTPNFFPLYHDVPEKPRLKGLGKGYDYDVVNSDIILNRMSVRDGRLVLPDGLSYAILMLPDQVHMPLEVLKKISELVKAGATVVGQRPTTVPGLKDWEKENAELSQLAGELWGKSDGKTIFGNTYGKGQVIWGLTADEVLAEKGLEPDFSFTGNLGIDYIHRTTDTGEIYFLRNDREEPVSGICRFRVSGKFPELWDASTGTAVRLTDYSIDKTGIGFEIELPAHGSVFVVFNNEIRKNLSEFVDNKQIASKSEIKGPWKVNFPPNWGAPPSAVFDRLISWTESENQGIKYFSGTAIYLNSFKVDAEMVNKGMILDLGEVRDVAEVFVNGKSAGIVWKKPYQSDISQLVKAGDNDLKIEIVNLWVNRLTGDMLSDPKDRFCKTNMTYMKSEVWPGGDEPFRLQPAGLLGPVTLSFRLAVPLAPSLRK